MSLADIFVNVITKLALLYGYMMLPIYKLLTPIREFFADPRVMEFMQGYIRAKKWLV